MATKPAGTELLTGQGQALASLPLDSKMKATSGDRGETVGPPSGTLQTQIQSAYTNGTAPTGQPDQFAGMGPWLEDDDKAVFDSVHAMVLRQEIVALNQLAQDTHWTYVKLGYPWSTLTKKPGIDRYEQSLPYGSSGVSIQAVPNKAWDVINKTTEALLVDFPQIEAEPGDDGERAQAAADYITRFLTQNASEQGTNDVVLWNDRVARSLTCASSFLECWTDPTGGGYIPLQIPAHPQAVSPMQPMLGPNGAPTVSPILRYVTSVGPDGQPTAQSQFTEDATKAAPQWQPKLIAQKWQNEHIRVYPESKTVDQAEKVIILGYCTLSEAKRRWSEVEAMKDDELAKLTDWTPPRYPALLPFYLRARWKLTDGRDKAKQGSSDERIMFYYHPFVKACPDYRKGADVVVTGAFQGRILDKQFLSAEVEVPSDGTSDQGSPTGEQGTTTKETRCMEIPVVQITPRGDPDEQNPRGRAYIELFAGAVESNAHLALSAAEVIDKNLHIEGYSSSTSPVSGQQREDARATGDLIPLVRPEDMPKWGEPVSFEANFFRLYELSDEAINSISASERAATGQDNAKERSGVAIRLASSNNNVSLGGMNNAVNNAYCRWNRIKVEQAMAKFTTAQQVNYVGDDGIFKQEDVTAVDFALVGKMTVKTGTGTVQSPEQKIQNLAGLVQNGMLSKDDGAEAARPAYSKQLGLPASAHEQRIERQITAFLKGVPTPEWIQQYRDFQQAQQVYQQQLQQYQQAVAEYQQQQAVAAQNAQAEQAQRLQDQSRQADTQAKAQESAAQREHALELERVKAELTMRAKQSEPPVQPPVPHEPAPAPAITHIHIGGKKTTVIRKNPDGSMVAESTPEETA